MNLDKHELAYKDYLKKNRELNKLHDEIRKMPLVPVKEPYQKGWIISFDVRDDIKNREDFGDINKIVKMVYQPFQTSSVKLVKLIRQVKSLDDLIQRKMFADYTHYSYYRRGVYQSEYDKLTVAQKKLLELDKEYEYKYSGRKYYKANLPSYWLIVKARPNIITHTREVDGKLLSNYNKLDSEISMLRYRFGTNYSATYLTGSDRTNIRGRIAKFMKNEIDDTGLVTEVFYDYWY